MITPKLPLIETHMTVLLAKTSSHSYAQTTSSRDNEVYGVWISSELTVSSCVFPFMKALRNERLRHRAGLPCQKKGE